MVIKIGGVEIDKTSKVEEITQLRAGLDELGVHTPLEGYEWIKEMSIDERLEFISIITDYSIDNITSFFTFGLF